MMRIDICVITFQRRAGLHRLLESIAALKFKEIVPDVSVQVVDNDPAGSARAVAAEMAVRLPFRLIYEIEPRRGISAARNRAFAMAPAADFIAFVDDDETVSPDWLEQLLLEQSVDDADVVMGPVWPLFEPSSPAWVRSGGFFVKDNEKFGKIDENYGSTANILIRRSCLAGLAGPFAAEFNLSGGADYHLLQCLRGSGAKISWASRAMVKEYIEPHRTNATWILKRRFRIGNTIALAERLAKPSSFGLRLLKGLLRIFQGVVLLPWALLRGRVETVHKLGQVCFGCGIIAGFCGYHYQEYEFRKNEHA